MKVLERTVGTILKKSDRIIHEKNKSISISDKHNDTVTGTTDNIENL